MHDERVEGLNEFNNEVKNGNFPYKNTNISMYKGEKDKFLESLDKWKPVHQ